MEVECLQVIREYARYWRCDLDALEVIRSERTVRGGLCPVYFLPLDTYF